MSLLVRRTVNVRAGGAVAVCQQSWIARPRGFSCTSQYLLWLVTELKASFYPPLSTSPSLFGCFVLTKVGKKEMETKKVVGDIGLFPPPPSTLIEITVLMLLLLSEFRSVYGSYLRFKACRCYSVSFSCSPDSIV